MSEGGALEVWLRARRSSTGILHGERWCCFSQLWRLRPFQRFRWCRMVRLSVCGVQCIGCGTWNVCQRDTAMQMMQIAWLLRFASGIRFPSAGLLRGAKIGDSRRGSAMRFFPSHVVQAYERPRLSSTLMIAVQSQGDYLQSIYAPLLPVTELPPGTSLSNNLRTPTGRTVLVRSARFVLAAAGTKDT